MNPFHTKKTDLNSNAKTQNKKVNRPDRQWMQPLESRRLLSVTPALDLIPDASTSTISGYTPSEISTGYSLSGLTFNSGKVAANGAGQTIAVVDAYNDPNIASDLKTFDTKFGLAAASLKVVNQTGGSKLPASNGGWAEEISLDVEWIHAIAPGASILLVETNSSSTSDLIAGVNYARSATGVSVVSMSWGGSEFNGETSYDTDFTTPSGHTGVTFVAASGDEGSFSGVEWPASSPDVLSVGGTTLTLNASGKYVSESGWSDSTGGVSQYEGEPEYQNSVQSDDARTVPDVASDANPSTGVAVYDSYSYDGYSGWLDFGGTSAAAPQWAGLVAIADQGRTINKVNTLDGATNTLPTLYSLESSSSTYSADFHDITSGSTSFSISAGTGYDLVTGIGSAKANNLIPALVSSKTDTALTLTTATRYAPHWPPFFGGFFVATDHTTAISQVLATPQTSFIATVHGTSTLAITQALFDSSLPTTSQAIDATANPPAPSASPATISSDAITGASSVTSTPQLSLPVAAASTNSVQSASAVQTIGQDLLAVSRDAEEMMSQLARNLVIGLPHEEIAATNAMFSTSTTERTTAAGIAAAVVALAALQAEPKRAKRASVFSRKLIAIVE